MDIEFDPLEKYRNQVILGDCLAVMSDMLPDCVNLVISSPPYFGCRQYGNETLGREEDPRDYVKNIVAIAEGIKRVLHPEGSFYFNIGDVYFGTKGFSRNKGTWARKTDHHYKEHKIAKEDGKYLQHKQLLLLPSRIAAGMQDNGWLLRNDIIWEKTNAIPSHSPDRRLPVYEHIFHFVKNPKYYFNYEKAKEIGSHRDVIRTSVKPFKNHQATFSEGLIAPFVKTTSRVGDVVFDPFLGSGTTAVVAKKLGRDYVGIEINPEYVTVSQERLATVDGL